MIDVSSHWIVANFRSLDKLITVIAVYAAPSVCFQTFLQLFTDTLAPLTESSTSNNIIIMGDFNARVGWKGHLFQCDGGRTTLATTRKSMDTISNSKGNLLLSSLQREALTLLNGRSRSDSHGEFTFIKERGEEIVKSTIDLAFASSDSLEFIENFHVGEQFGSDHRMIHVSVSLQTQRANLPLHMSIRPFKKLRWDMEAKEGYGESFEFPSNSINAQRSDSPQKMYEILKEMIMEAAAKNGMVHTVRKSSVERNQQWYDQQCKEANRQRRKLLRSCKALKFEPESVTQYLEAKKACYNLFKEKRRNTQEWWQQTLEILETRFYFGKLSTLSEEADLLKSSSASQDGKASMKISQGLEK